MGTRRIALLGATGSIGISTLEVVAAHPERLRVVAMAAGGNWRRLVEQALRFRPAVVALHRHEAAREAEAALAGSGIRVLSGMAGVARVATWETADITLSAVVGAAGLAPTIAAIRAGKDVALANKECLVTAGALFMGEVARHGVRLLPVDSEHSAIFQVLGAGQGVRKLLLTASGGPFRGWPKERLAGVTPAQALAHPNWDMGRKISIDSATLMNKGLEVIEARWLFDMAPERIEVVVHPESIIHSMVEFVDGSVLSQMGVPDMRTPIAVALGWPERIDTPVAPLDLVAMGRLTFSAPDREAFPCLGLAFAALEAGGGAAAVLNAANEVAVEAFLNGRIGFTEIPALIEETLAAVRHPAPGSIEEVLELDRQARAGAAAWLDRRGP